MTQSDWKNFLHQGNYDFRQDQFEGVCGIADTFSYDNQKSKHLLLEAPTGSGKTLMYLGVAAIDKHKLLISTSGKLLQKQIADTWRHISLGDEPVVVKGRSNYICRNMVAIFCRRLDVDHQHYAVLQKILKYTEISPERDISIISSLLQWSPECDSFIRNNLLSDSALCLNDECVKVAGDNQPCAYSSLLQRAREKQIVIINHHTLITIAANNKTATEQLYKDRMLVVDEAHDIADVAISVTTKQISTATLNKLVSDIKALLDDDVKNILGIYNVDNMVEALLHLQETLNNIDCRDDYHVFQSADEIKNILLKDCLRLAEAKPLNNIFNNNSLIGIRFRNLLQRYHTVCAELSAHFFAETTEIDLGSDLTAIMDFIMSGYRIQNPHYFVYYLQVDSENKVRQLKRAFINPQLFLSSIWDYFSGVVFISATLTISVSMDKDDFAWSAEQLGVNHYRTIRLPGLFDMQKQCNIFIASPESNFLKPSGVIPEPYLKSCIQLTGKLIRAFQGRTLSLYTANMRLSGAGWVLKRVFEELPACTLLVQEGQINKEELAEQFINNHECALLGSKSFFQGFDAPGETLSCLILEKLPFEQRNDPILEARCRNAGSNFFHKIILPEMLMTLRQAFGRLIRSVNDRGIFVLADPRCLLPTTSYGPSILKTLGVDREGAYHTFGDADELLSHDCLKKLPFELDCVSDFDAVFELVWSEFQKTGMFRKITKINTLEDILQKFGISKLHAWQKEIIDEVLNGNLHKTMVVYPAGSGKSLTYQIPALMQSHGLTLVVSPLVSLMFDQLQSLQRKGFVNECAMLSSGISKADSESVIKRLVDDSLRLLYVTPERLAGGFFNFLKTIPGKVQLLVIDEAHMICEAGANFRPLYYELGNVWQELDRPPLMLVTATAGKNVVDDISKRFELEPQQIRRESIIRRNVRLTVMKFERIEAHYNIAENFIRRAQGRPVLIYAQQVKFVESLKKWLLAKRDNHCQIRTYHSQLPESERNQNHLAFLNGEVQVMIATSAYGMGIDKPNIWGVLFNNIPGSLEELVQGIGRICRNTKLLEVYSRFGVEQTAQVEVIYFSQDYDTAREIFIEKPLRETSMEAICIIENLHQKNGDDEITVDLNAGNEQFKNCWITLRFLKKNGYLDDFRFSWDNSCFRLRGNNLRFYNLKTVKEEFELEQQLLLWNKLIALESMKNFCRTSSCRNKFLQSYFNETDVPQNCYLCDQCPTQDIDKHQVYYGEIQKEMAAARKILYRNGIFVGTDDDFEQIFESCIKLNNDQFGIRLNQIEHQHSETGLLSSDYMILSLLLQITRQYKDKQIWSINELPELFDCWRKLQIASNHLPTLESCERSRQRIVKWGQRMPHFPLTLDDDLERLEKFSRMFDDILNVPPYPAFSSDGEMLQPIEDLRAGIQEFESKFGAIKEYDPFYTLFCATPQNLPSVESVNIVLGKGDFRGDNGWLEWSSALKFAQNIYRKCLSFHEVNYEDLQSLGQCINALSRLPEPLAQLLRKCLANHPEVKNELTWLFADENRRVRGILVESLADPAKQIDLKPFKKFPKIKDCLLNIYYESENREYDKFMTRIVSAVKTQTLSVDDMMAIQNKKVKAQDFYGYWQGTEIPEDLKSVTCFALFDRGLKKNAPNEVFVSLEKWLRNLSPDHWLLPIYRQSVTQPALSEILQNPSESLKWIGYYNKGNNEELLNHKDDIFKQYPALCKIFAEDIADFADVGLPSDSLEAQKVFGSFEELAKALK